MLDSKQGTLVPGILPARLLGDIIGLDAPPTWYEKLSNWTPWLCKAEDYLMTEDVQSSSAFRCIPEPKRGCSGSWGIEPEGQRSLYSDGEWATWFHQLPA